MPDFVDWWAHRIASSQHYSDGLADVRDGWNMAELFEAHAVLDVIDEAQTPDPTE